MQEIRHALSVEKFKTLMKLGGSAFFYHCALAILNNVVGDKILPPEEIFLGLSSK